MNLLRSSLVEKYNSELLVRATESLKSLIPPCGMPLYTSIDLRDSGSRLVAVDVNLFPAGFNNLGAQAIENAVQEMRAFFTTKLKRASGWKLGLIPEGHTNNEGYLYNLQTLKGILEKAGAEVLLAWPGIPIPKPWEFKFGTSSLTYHPIDSVTAWSEAVVLNHDLSGGPLAALEGYSKPIFPNPELGWYKRKKSEHFGIALKVLKNLASRIPEIEPRDFIADSMAVSDLNFQQKVDIERLVTEAGAFVEKIQEHDSKAFVYMKNDSGTYGLGIWKFSSQSELHGASKILQKIFQRGKQGTQVRRVILQEGIRTRLLTNSTENAEFEPVVYSVKGTKIGTFFRYGFSDKGTVGEMNLNRPGSWFEETSKYSEDHAVMRPLYTFVALLHSVAAAIEDCPCESVLKG